VVAAHEHPVAQRHQLLGVERRPLRGLTMLDDVGAQVLPVGRPGIEPASQLLTHPTDDARVERFRRLYDSAGVEADAAVAATAAARYRARYLEARRAVRGAAALLEQVKQRAAVAIVSNNLLEEQQEKLRFCGLDPFVDVLVVSGEIGISKPDPRIFELAVQRLGVPPGRAVFVDDFLKNVDAARAAGLVAVHFQNTPQVIADLRQLLG